MFAYENLTGEGGTGTTQPTCIPALLAGRMGVRQIEGQLGGVAAAIEIHASPPRCLRDVPPPCAFVVVVVLTMHRRCVASRNTTVLGPRVHRWVTLTLKLQRLLFHPWCGSSHSIWCLREFFEPCMEIAAALFVRVWLTS